MKEVAFKFVVSSTLAFLSYVYRVLYTQCVVRLQEIIQVHAGTAALAVECFNELFGLICSHHKDKIEQFLGEVGTSV